MAFLLIQGARARVPVSTLLVAAGLMTGRTLISAIPLAGAAASDLLAAHRWSARLIVAAIDRRIAANADRASRAKTWRPSASQIYA